MGSREPRPFWATMARYEPFENHLYLKVRLTDYTIKKKIKNLTMVLQVGFGQPDYAHDAERCLSTYNHDRNVRQTVFGILRIAKNLLTHGKLPE